MTLQESIGEAMNQKENFNSLHKSISRSLDNSKDLILQNPTRACGARCDGCAVLYCTFVANGDGNKRRHLWPIRACRDIRNRI